MNSHLNVILLIFSPLFFTFVLCISPSSDVSFFFCKRCVTGCICFALFFELKNFIELLCVTLFKCKVYKVLTLIHIVI